MRRFILYFFRFGKPDRFLIRRFTRLRIIVIRFPLIFVRRPEGEIWIFVFDGGRRNVRRCFSFSLRPERFSFFVLSALSLGSFLFFALPFLFFLFFSIFSSALSFYGFSFLALPFFFFSSSSCSSSGGGGCSLRFFFLLLLYLCLLYTSPSPRD